jgi:sugar lactone lactonase YvrE
MATLPDGSLLVDVLRYSPFGGGPAVPGEVWRVGTDGSAAVFLEDVLLGNGIGVAPEEDTVYICDYARGEVIAVAPDGSDRRTLARSPTGEADGLAVDAEGGVWVALGNGGGVGRFTRDGALERTVDTGAQFAASVCFDGEALYVASAGADGAGGILRGDVGVAGLGLAPARVAVTW